jgi:hypothetical protein
VYISLDGAANWSASRGLSTLNVCNVAVSSIPGQAPLLTFGAGDNNGFASDDGGANWRTQGYLGGDNDCSFSDPRQPTRMYVFAPRSKALNGIFGEIYTYVSKDVGYPDIKLNSSDLLRVLGSRSALGCAEIGGMGCSELVLEHRLPATRADPCG